MSRPLTLELSASARAELEQVRARDRRPYLRERAAFLLKLADGATIPQLAATGLLVRRHRDTLYGWLRAYRADGVAGLTMQPRRPRGFPPSGSGHAARYGSPRATAAGGRARPLAVDRSAGAYPRACRLHAGWGKSGLGPARTAAQARSVTAPLTRSRLSPQSGRGPRGGECGANERGHHCRALCR